MLAFYIPNFCGLICTAGQDPLPVRRKANGKNVIGMPLKGKELLSADRIPDLGEHILTAARDPPAVRRKDCGVNPVVVTTEGEQ